MTDLSPPSRSGSTTSFLRLMSEYGQPKALGTNGDTLRHCGQVGGQVGGQVPVVSRIFGSFDVSDASAAGSGTHSLRRGRQGG